MAQGGTQFANAIREAQFGLRTVGFSPQAQRVAGINERAANDINALQTDPNDPLLRDFQINAIRERARIELETARQQAVYDTASAAAGIGWAWGRRRPNIATATTMPRPGTASTPICWSRKAIRRAGSTHARSRRPEPKASRSSCRTRRAATA